ncbi:ribonucleoside hydrolase RihC [Bombiscardovia apis]|uniref:Ribonucleoside hydrolase RihC n=1 Tax=Bombiscardovia apis TaxID=2932182 RepID=A0ABM8BAP8_9BIFI|nr:nucleoside hydrolase [Bombiscardovia apis]BDR53994.1 ribonucleoside hydrolase RihC [Bombiscardovia apis]
MNARPIIIDTAPGIDDAVAIALLHADPSVDVKLVASVAGEVPVEQATQSIEKLLTFLRQQTPVAQGASSPLMRPNMFSKQGRDLDVFDTANWPTPHRSLLTVESAVLEERRVLMESERPVTIITLGPLTNIALLLTAFPEVKSRIEQIVMMVGTTGRGDATVYGEFNAVCDPEAAGIVFRSELPLVMAGLEVGCKVRLQEEDLVTIAASGRVGALLVKILRRQANDKPGSGMRLYSSSAAMYLLEPGLFTTRRAQVEVEIGSNLTLGATVANFDVRREVAEGAADTMSPIRSLSRSESAAVASNATICVDVDVCGLKASFLKRLSQAN